MAFNYCQSLFRQTTDKVFLLENLWLLPNTGLIVNIA